MYPQLRFGPGSDYHIHISFSNSKALSHPLKNQVCLIRLENIGYNLLLKIKENAQGSLVVQIRWIPLHKMHSTAILTCVLSFRTCALLHSFYSLG